MELIIDLWPFWLLIAFVVVVIRKGMRQDTHDRDTGGGEGGSGE